MHSVAVKKPTKQAFFQKETPKYATKTVNSGLETGLYYYGARYLDPKTSRWISADPAMGEYIPLAPINDDAKKHNGNLPGMGGIFNLVNMHTYHYAGNNPINLIDPTGMWIDNEDGTHTAEKGDTLWGLYGADWQEKSGYTGDPKQLQIGETVGFRRPTRPTRAEIFNNRIRQPMEYPPKVPMRNRRDDYTVFSFGFSPDAPINSRQYAGIIYISDPSAGLQMIGRVQLIGAAGNSINLRLVLSDEYGIRRYIGYINRNNNYLSDALFGVYFDLNGYNLDGNYFDVYIEKINGSLGIYADGTMSGRR